MAIRVFWTVLYGLLMACFFLVGIYLPYLGWAGFIVLPLMTSAIVGYFSKQIREAFSVIVVGLVVYGVIALILIGVLSTSIANALYWVHEASWPQLSEAELHATMYNETVYALSIMCIGFFMIQISLTVGGVSVGIFVKKLQRMLQPAKDRIISYGDFTTEGITRTGVVKVRVIGTIPEELYEWMKKEVEASNYVNQSHIIEAALRKLKEEREEP